MTDLLSRPILRVPQAAAGPDRPVALVAALGAAGVALGGLLFCVAVSAAGWFAADTGSFGQAMSIGALAWLVGNGVRSVRRRHLGGGDPAGLRAAGRVWRCTAPADGRPRPPASGPGTTSALAVLAMMRRVRRPRRPRRGRRRRQRGAAGPVAGGRRVRGWLPLVFGGAGLLQRRQTGPSAVRPAARGGSGGPARWGRRRPGDDRRRARSLLAASLVAHFGTAMTLAEGHARGPGRRRDLRPGRCRPRAERRAVRGGLRRRAGLRRRRGHPGVARAGCASGCCPTSRLLAALPTSASGLVAAGADRAAGPRRWRGRHRRGTALPGLRRSTGRPSAAPSPGWSADWCSA